MVVWYLQTSFSERRIEEMNLTGIILVAVIIWMVYTMYKSYQAMQNELKEIRLKCMGTSKSQYQSDPTEDMRTTLLGALGSLAKVSE
jgi:hypothetical protein